MRSVTSTTALFTIILALVVFSNGFPEQPKRFLQYFIPVASAEDDGEYEREEENEEEDDDDGDRESSSQEESSTTTTKIEKIAQNVVEYKPVTRTVIVTDEAYKTDSDGDLLMDALDPNPSVKQSEYFTDIDGDSVPNALDKHHDENDFVFFDDFETDENANGILDSYEQ